MKRPSHVLQLLMLSTFVLLAIGIGNAQYGQILKVKIPFDFNVGKQNFPAGDYTLKQSTIQHTMLLRDDRGQVLISIGTNSVASNQPPEAPKLVFNGYSGGRYFLAQIWEQENNQGEQLVMSPVEIEVARHPPGLTAVRYVTH
jgi:hypothetical protein